MIRDDLERIGDHPGRVVSPHIQVCAALRYLASNDFQMDIGDSLHISQSSVSRAVHSVVDALAEKIGQFVKFPTNDESVREKKQGLYALARFPNAVGLIDGTHIRVLAPRDEEYAYVNRKGFTTH